MFLPDCSFKYEQAACVPGMIFTANKSPFVCSEVILQTETEKTEYRKTIVKGDYLFIYLFFV